MLYEVRNRFDLESDFSSPSNSSIASVESEKSKAWDLRCTKAKAPLFTENTSWHENITHSAQCPKREQANGCVESNNSVGVIFDIAFVFAVPVVHYAVVVLIEMLIVVLIAEKHPEEISRFVP